METSSEAFDGKKVEKHMYEFIGDLIGAVGRRGPLGGLFVQPTWETTYRREFRANQERRKRLKKKIKNICSLFLSDMCHPEKS